ncbi:16S rRNA (uracil(1498)-N(3))-methyltransferase [Caldanaerobacter sp.]|uniref:16S rRNA (uracil(1498)-N(3))-methyltransferase n=1 Tax=Caldanaerobacter sp. TaxID=2930036 RepID=UPI003C776BFB
MKKVFVEKEKIKGNFAYVEGKDFHHLIHVLRYRVGDKIVVSNMKEEYLGRIEKIEKERAILFLEEKVETKAESPLEVFLFQGILKADKMDLIVQKCTEIGVRRIIPFVSEFSVVDIKRANIDKKVERWKKISQEACKQSGRNIMPEIFAPISFEEAIEKAMECELAIIPYEKEEKKRLKEVLKDVEDAKKIGIFIGPEGGFSQREIEKAINNGIVPVTLGPRILRAETAAIAVSAIIMYQLGDMG